MNKEDIEAESPQKEESESVSLNSERVEEDGKSAGEKALTEDMKTESNVSSQEHLSVATNGVHDLLITED